MDSPWQLFKTARQKLMEAYAGAKAPFEASTQPYKSVATLIAEIVDRHPTAAPTMAHAVFRKGQQLTWFGYGLSDQQIPTGVPGVNRAVTDALTNLVTGRETNGSEEFVVESLSASQHALRVQWVMATGEGVETVTDPSVIAAYAGTVSFYDPGALATPPQCFGPFNLENVFFEAFRSVLSLEIQFDRKKSQHLGTLDQLFEGSGKSYLRTSGEPAPNARWKIPEGKIWRKKGQADSDFIVIGELREDVVIPIDLPVSILGQTRPAATLPQRILLDVALRAHGISIQQVSQN